MGPYTQMLQSCKSDLRERLERNEDGEWIMPDSQYDALAVAVGNADSETITAWITATLLRVADLEDERAANELHRTHQEKCAAELTTQVEDATANIDEMETVIEKYQVQLLTIRDSIQAMRRAINNRGFVALTPEQFNIITAQLQIVYELAVD